MKTMMLLAATLTVAFVLGGCSKGSDNAVDQAVENSKDALDMRDNEKLKDAAEDMKDAAKDSADAVKDAAADLKDKAKDATSN